MKLHFLPCLVSLAAVGSFGCSGDGIRTQCFVDCNSSVTFALGTPLVGRDLAISVGFPDGSVERLDCQPGDGSVACIPVSTRVEPSFTAAGALQSVRVGYPPTGTYAVQIAVDGTPAAAGSFSYQPPSDTPITGPCPGARCAGSQTFAVGN